MKPDLTKKAIAANIEAMRQMLMDAVLRSSEAFQAIGAMLASTGIWKMRSRSTAQPSPCSGPGGRHEKDH